MAVIIVDQAFDEQDGSVFDGDVSLRDALALAQEGDVIRFDDFVFASDGDPQNNTAITLTLGELVLSNGVTIDGDVNGDGVADVTLVGAGSRILSLDPGANGVANRFHLHGLAFVDGDASLYSGGAIQAVDREDSLLVSNSLFLNNFSRFGGAIATFADTTIVNSYFSGNHAEALGGAIRNYGAMEIVNSTFTQNYTQESTFTDSGGGVIETASFQGALTIRNSTITGNYSAGNGAAISAPVVVLENSIIAGNQAAEIAPDVEGTVQSNGANIFGSAVTGAAPGDQTVSVFDFGDLFEDVGPVTVGGATFDAGRVTSTFGISPTVGITQGGFASNTGLNADLPTEADLGIDVDGDGTIEATPIEIDARGLARISEGTVDIGAAENPSVIIVDNIGNQDDGDYSAGNLTLREAIGLADDGDVIRFDPTVFTADDDQYNNTEIVLSFSQGTLLIDGDRQITIDGDTNGDGKADVTIRGNGSQGVTLITVEDGSNATLESLTLTNGTGSAVRAFGRTKVLNSNFVDNSVSLAGNDDFGGAIYSLNQPLTVANSTFVNNTATRGGALYLRTGQAQIINSTFYDNYATYRGGAVYLRGFALLRNLTVTGNDAGFDGGALHVGTSGFARIGNSIITGNDDEISGSVVTQGGNLFGGAGGYAYTPSIPPLPDLTFVDPSEVFQNVTTVTHGANTFEAGALADNGGPTETILSLLGGPAADFGDSSQVSTEQQLGLDLNGDGILSTDTAETVAQRGELRLQGPAVDAGAVELDHLVDQTVFVVDTTSDLEDGDVSAGQLSLREALRLATDGDRIVFDPNLFTPDGNELFNTTIFLTEGTIVIDGKQVIIDGDTDGDGTADVTVDGSLNGPVSAFRVQNSGDLELRGLTLQQTAGRAVTAFDADRLAVVNSTFQLNSSQSLGGAIFASDTPTTIAGSTFLANSGPFGGAIFQYLGSLTVANSTFHGNHALLDGSDVYLGGGAIATQEADLTLVYTTISGNRSEGFGGGVSVRDGTFDVKNSIIVGNSAAQAGSADFYGTDPTISGYAAIGSFNGGNVLGTVSADTSLAGELLNVTPQEVFASVAPIQVGAATFDAGEHDDNGGPTRTILTLMNGVAVDRGDSNGVPLIELDLGIDVDGDGTISFDPADTVDQRGGTRLQGDAADAGAVELDLSRIEVTTVEDTMDGDLSPNDISWREALSLVLDGGTIVFSPRVFATDDDPLTNTTIVLTSGTETITRDVTIDGDADGDGIADVTFDGSANQASTMLRVDAGSQVFLRNLDFQDADASGMSGGAIDNGGSLHILNSSFQGNTTDNGGGAIFNREGAQAVITGGFFTGNTARNGGAIENQSLLTIANSTFHGNYGSYGGGAIQNSPAGQFSLNRLQLINVSASGNYARGNGDGLAVAGGTVDVFNTIIAGNGRSARDVTGSILSDGTNILGSETSGADRSDVILRSPSDLAEVFATVGQLTVGRGRFDAASLEDNGGLVPSLGLNATNRSNPALDGGGLSALDETAMNTDFDGDGSVGGSLTEDGRGLARPVDLPLGGAGPDIGSFETQTVATPGPDFLAGDSTGESINGEGGNDLVDGGLGNDTLDGGAGDDTLSFASLQDPGFVFGEQVFGVFANLSTQGTAQNTGAGLDTFENFENLEGSQFGDLLTGDGAANTLLGGAGGDVLNGGDGDDVLIGGEGFDAVEGGAGADQLFGGTGGAAVEGDIATYFSATGPLVFDFGATTSEIEVGSSAEVLEDTIGADIEGVAGAGGHSNTFLGDELTGLTFFLGGSQSDTFQGGSGVDQLIGLGGDDVMYGNDGGDALIGEGGDDDLFGGAGSDVFFFDGVDGNDTIHDLEFGVDLIFFAGSGLSLGDLTFTSVAVGGGAEADTRVDYQVTGQTASSITVIDKEIAEVQASILFG